MGISISTRQAYSEIDEFIELLSYDEQNKIPQKLKEYFKKEKDKQYKKGIDPNIPIINQKLKDETLAIIALLNLQYWCEDEKEKERLKKIYIENDRKYQEMLREKYNPDNLFTSKRNEKVEDVSNLPIEIKREKFYNRILNFIKRILNI